MEYLNIKCRDEDLLPSRANPSDAGIDLLSDADIFPGASQEEGGIPPKEFPVVVPTGVSVDIPDGYVGLLTLRSSLGAKGYLINNSPGIIDSGYRGEIMVTLDFLGLYTPEAEIKRGDRIAQLVIVPAVTPWLNVVDEFEGETARGDGGFGSTGV